ncbi:MAG: RuBisCO large subunit C-terminal-like domain-containing protein [Candidatus Limnocylindria bacterium]
MGSLERYPDRAYANAEEVVADHVIATYLLREPVLDIFERALGMAMEQTVGAATYRDAESATLIAAHGGKVIAIQEIPDHEHLDHPLAVDAAPDPQERTYLVQVAYPAANAAGQIPMLLTTVFGDVSQVGRIKMVDLTLPRAFLDGFRGPRFGVEGLRRLTGVTDRPLVCGILKPCIGLTVPETAALFRELAEGGADIVKDDELNGQNQPDHLRERVAAVAKEAQRIKEEHGRTVLYMANVTDRADRMLEKARIAVDAGAGAVMLTAITTGWSALQQVAEDNDVSVPVYAHSALSAPLSLSPEYGISSHIVLGKLPRLAGADMSSFSTPFGRFPARPEKWMRLSKVLRSPLGNLAPTMPMTGGGLDARVAAPALAALGRDVVLIGGGRVQGHPMGHRAGVRSLRLAIDAAIQGRPLEDAAREHRELAYLFESTSDGR